VSDYVEKTRQFSRNANLYVLHVIGIDMIHGSFNVLFNLYLLALGFLSLIPVLMLRSVEAVERPEEQTDGPVPARRGLTTLFSGIRHPRRIAYFVLTSAFIALGTSTVVPLLNVVFHEGDLHAGEGEIGVMFAVGAMALALATLCVPLLADRMLNDVIAVTRLAALPFVLGMGLLPLVFDEGALLLLLVGASYVGRITIFRMGSPLDDAFNMEVLDARERATNTGFEIAVGSAVSAVADPCGLQAHGLGRLRDALPDHGDRVSNLHDDLLAGLPSPGDIGVDTSSGSEPRRRVCGLAFGYTNNGRMSP
jgi:hypothetical protein